MRLISLCPSLTELVFALGCGSFLVGRSRYCIRPTESVDAIETVGGTKKPDLDAIRRLRPDLVLMNEEENRREDHRALTESGLECTVYFPQTVDETLAMIDDLAQRLGREREGRQLMATIESEQSEARRQRRQREQTGEAAPSFAYLIWRKPWMAVGTPSYVNHLLTLAGGRNVFAEAQDRYPAVSAEELAAAAPRWVLLSSEPFPFEESHRQELSDATGLPVDRFRLVDGQVLSWHGASTADGIRHAVEVIAGEFALKADSTKPTTESPP